MALSQFAASTSDTEKEQHQLTCIPEKTKNATPWGMRARSEWATACGSSIFELVRCGHLPVTTPLFDMPMNNLVC